MRQFLFAKKISKRPFKFTIDSNILNTCLEKKLSKYYVFMNHMIIVHIIEIIVIWAFLKMQYHNKFQCTVFAVNFNIQLK